MSGFSIRNPHLIIIGCLLIAVLGLTSVIRMPIDLFPAINIPEVVVATFYNGMPPEEIETDITWGITYPGFNRGAMRLRRPGYRYRGTRYRVQVFRQQQF